MCDFNIKAIVGFWLSCGDLKKRWPAFCEFDIDVKKCNANAAGRVLVVACGELVVACGVESWQSSDLRLANNNKNGFIALVHSHTPTYVLQYSDQAGWQTLVGLGD